MTERTVAESLGYSAFSDGLGLDRNPFSFLRESDKRSEWFNGWYAARDSAIVDFRNRVKMAKDMSQTTGQMTQPRIWITVEREINGHRVNSVRQLDFELWRQGKLSGRIFDVEVNAMMKEVHYGN